MSDLCGARFTGQWKTNNQFMCNLEAGHEHVQQPPRVQHEQWQRVHRVEDQRGRLLMSWRVGETT